MACNNWYSVWLILLIVVEFSKCDFLIDQRLKEEIRQRPPPSPFLNTLYDKSFYYNGPQRPIYNVDFSLTINSLKFDFNCKIV